MLHRKYSIFIIATLAAVLLINCNKLDFLNPFKPNSQLAKDGKEIFRYDTYNDETFWSGLLHIDKAIAGAANGGFGGGVSPKPALAVGLKVDAAVLPANVVAG